MRARLEEERREADEKGEEIERMKKQMGGDGKQKVVSEEVGRGFYHIWNNTQLTGVHPK